MASFLPTSTLRRRWLSSLVLAGVLSLAGWRVDPIILKAATVDAINFLLTIGTPGSLPGQFVAPQGVAYDPSGRLYVTDSEWFGVVSFRVQVFGTDHQRLYDLAPEAPFNYPVGIAVDAAGRVIVADAGNDRVVVFEAGTNARPGAELAAAGTKGNYDPLDPGAQPGTAPVTPLTLWFPAGVALKPGTLLRQPANTAGRVAVVDTGNHRIVVLDSMLAPIYAFGGHTLGGLSSPAGMFEYPWGIAIDPAGHYYVADSENRRVQVFQEVTDAQGQKSAAVIRTFGSPIDPVSGQLRSDPGDLGRPYGMTFDAKGRLWVADTDSHRVMRIDVTTDVGDASGLTPCATIGAWQVESRCLVTTSDNQYYEALVVGARGGGVEAGFQYPMSVAVSPAQELAVADSDNHVVQVFNAFEAGLSFAGPGTAPSGPYAVNVPLPLSVSLKNDGSVAVDVSIAPGLAADSTGDGIFSAAASRSIAPGETTIFTFTFTPTAPGPVSFEVAASGVADALALVGGQVNAGTQAIPGGNVGEATGMSVTASTATARLRAGDTFTLNVRLRNTAATTLTNVTTAVLISDPSMVQALAPAGSLTTLPGFGTADLAYQYKLLGVGSLTFTVSAAASCDDPVRPTATCVSASAPAVTVTVMDDAQAPTTTAVLPPLPASGWFNAPVPLSFQLAAADNAGGSGVESVTVTVIEDNTTVTVPGHTVPMSLDRQGTTRVRFHATDRAGNVEADQLLTVKIDSYAPDLGAPVVTSALPPANGWYRTAPTITFVAGDSGGSELARVTPPATVTSEGWNQIRTGSAEDVAGNRSREATATVNVDTIAPVLVCAPARLPDAGQWYRANVGVSCFALEPDPAHVGVSGVQSVRALCSASNQRTGASTASCTYSTDGVHTFLAEATDVAGNVSTATFQVRLDKTPPALVCSTVSTGLLWPPNHKMVPWNTSVQVMDALSGSFGYRLTAYSSSEARNEPGDGNTDPDMAGWVLNTPDTSGFVRSERTGAGTGRIYRLTYSGFDQAGNVSSCTTVLTQVPHNK